MSALSDYANSLWRSPEESAFATGAGIVFGPVGTVAVAGRDRVRDWWRHGRPRKRREREAREQAIEEARRQRLLEYLAVQEVMQGAEQAAGPGLFAILSRRQVQEARSAPDVGDIEVSPFEGLEPFAERD